MVGLNNKKNNILIDYYEGAYGPTIRIDTQSVEAALQVKNIFMELALAQVSEINFHNVENVKVTGLKALILRLVVEGKEHRKTLKLIELISEGPVFHWSRSSEGWEDCVGLLNGMLKNSSHPSHQYLTDEDVDDALVEIIFLE